MLDLVLRGEFRGKKLKGTTVDFTNQSKTGALEVTAADFLGITYPSHDLLMTIDATKPEQSRPVVLLGDKGQGKSHLLAALYHVSKDSASGRDWLNQWADRLGSEDIRRLTIRSDCEVIAESLHKNRHKYLWDILFERHPKGQKYLGKWEALAGKKTDVPSTDIIAEMLAERPTMLILDEFQTWYAGLKETKQEPARSWAFNFIQNLSEIAQQNPELLVLVVSIRESDSEAYQQMHRVNPVLVDFKSPLATRDRQRLLLYRLFENRMQVPRSQIEAAVDVHVREYFRLAEVPHADQERRREDFIEAWPYAPHLLKLLEDQVLIATAAQETRDLIKILVQIFKNAGASQPIITAADFALPDEQSGVGALIDSVANQLHRDLRQKALRNLEAVKEAVANPAIEVPHCEQLISALWLRSLTVDKLAGATAAELQIDITHGRPIDDNQFQVELGMIAEHSFNIHPIDSRFVFKTEENPQAKLLAHAKNDKEWKEGADIEHLAKEVRMLIGGPEQVSASHRVVVLKKLWDGDPWSELDEKEHPKNWDNRLTLVVVPYYPENLSKSLGTWLKSFLQDGRNTIRFLLPQRGTPSIYFDRDLIILSRAIYLAQQWRKTEPVYGDFQKRYHEELVAKLKTRFDRFAILDVWNFADPAKCVFQEQAHKSQGSKIPEAIDAMIRESMFEPEELDEYIELLAESSESVGKLLRDLREPRPGGKPCIPWLGDVFVKEHVVGLCAEGKIAINLRNMDVMQAKPGEDRESAWQRMKGRLGTGKHLDETMIQKPDAVVSSGGVTAPNPGAITGTTTGANGGSGFASGGADPSGSSGPSIGGLFGGTGGVGSGAGSSTTSGGAGSTSGGFGSGLFGGGSTGTTVPTRTPHQAAPTSSLNLLGTVESWGIGPATSVSNIALRIPKMTGAQLNSLLKLLPDGVTYGLELEKEAR